MFVHIPVNSTECFPTTIEVISILDIRIRFAEVTETGPYLQIFSNVVTRVQLYQHLRNFSYDIAGGINPRCCPVTKGHSRFILLILRTLVSEEEMEIKSFERFQNCIRRPSYCFNIITQCSRLNILIIIRINQIQGRVVVGLGNVTE